MNQDDVIREVQAEEQAERRELALRMHPQLRQWYNSDAAAVPLHDKFGAFPPLPQELVEWPHFREVYKRYLASTEPGDEEVCIRPELSAVINFTILNTHHDGSKHLQYFIVTLR